MLGVNLALLAAGAPGLLSSAYLGLLACNAATPDSPPGATSSPFFSLVVPAHNEESGIARTVESLLGVDYPRDQFQVVVVADNCSDKTAERARAAGAQVLERRDLSRRGKGYALEYAFEKLLADGRTHAVVVVDADTSVSSNLLRAMAARFEAGEQAVQAHYGVRNGDASWRTRLMVLAFAMFHGVRSNARERFGLSVGLRGNGMGFLAETLRKVPYCAYSLVEDVEYGIALGMQGVRIAYVGDAEVLGDMVAEERDSRSQRRRWEEGRAALKKQFGPQLLGRALSERSLLLFDLAADLLIPPLSSVAVNTALGLAGSAGLWAAGLASPWVPLVFLGGSGLLVLYVGRGAALSGLGLQVFADLLRVPGYVVWKQSLKRKARSVAKDEWVRTARAGEAAE
ncbi:MAG: glycosyltransferase family 2 protein [Polyangiaceae bacterium]